MKTPPPNPWALVKKVQAPDPQKALLGKILDPNATELELEEANKKAMDARQKTPWSGGR